MTESDDDDHWSKIKLGPDGYFTMTESVNPKTIAGSTKPGIGLVPPIAIFVATQAALRHGFWLPIEPWFSVQIVHELGAKKYGAWNWRETKIPISVYVSAIARHLEAVDRGNDLDLESGQLHFAHIIAGAGIMLDAWNSGSLIDDRKLSQNNFIRNWMLGFKPPDGTCEAVNFVFSALAAFAAGADIEVTLGDVILLAACGYKLTKE